MATGFVPLLREALPIGRVLVPGSLPSNPFRSS